VQSAITIAVEGFTDAAVLKHAVIARFLSISRSKVPTDPDHLSKPKEALIGLAMRSKSRAIREAIVPVQGMTARVGPGYSSVMALFAAEKWRPRVAAKKSPSLCRLMHYLDNLAPEGKQC